MFPPSCHIQLPPFSLSSVLITTLYAVNSNTLIAEKSMSMPVPVLKGRAQIPGARRRGASRRRSGGGGGWAALARRRLRPRDALALHPSGTGTHGCMVNPE